MKIAWNSHKTFHERPWNILGFFFKSPEPLDQYWFKYNGHGKGSRIEEQNYF